MSKLGISLSNGDGRNTSTPTSSVNYDDVTQYLTINDISGSNFVLSGANNAIISVSGGVFIPYNAANYSNYYMVTDGSKWIPALASITVGTASGDLSGSYPTPTIRNIGNVNTGSLKIANGGLSGSGQNNILNNISSGSLVIANSTSTLTAVSTASYNGIGDWVLGSTDGNSWRAVTASAPTMDINVQYFIGGSTTTLGGTYTWTKTSANHKWVRLLIQAGGGGGGGSQTTSYGASGGGAGGFTDVTQYIGNITTATIVVGAGGYQGTTNEVAETGGTSSFSLTGVFFSAAGGKGGIYGLSAGGVGGIGLTFNGSDGGDESSTAAAITPGVDGPGASGGGGGAYSAPITAENGGTAGRYTTNTTAPAGNGSYTPNLFGYNIPIGFGTGGRGGAYGVSGSFGVFGGGGGGAGRFITGGSVCYGGHGGSGFVVVISF